jgi:hypothetical protein
MNKRSTLRFVVLLGLAVVARAGIAAGQVTSGTCRIMPVGDSTTEGSRHFPVYRPLLRNMLEQAGHRVEDVGSRKTSGGLPHESYGGRNAECRRANPHVAVLVARVIPVDQTRGFEAETDTIDDKVHPNTTGAKKMAARWFEALEPLLKSKAAR